MVTQTKRGSRVPYLVGNWFEPDTTMKLPNGNVLVIYGKGEDKTITTPVCSIPGHKLVMVSEPGQSSRIVKRTRTNVVSPPKENNARIVWVEIGGNGDILLAGCSGCTKEEKQVLADWAEGNSERRDWAAHLSGQR
jgi:hypothetical protein